MTVYIGSNTTESTAELQIDSTTTGLLPPRMTTTQRNAISSPATGLTIYNTITGRLEHYNGTSWLFAGDDASNYDMFLPANSLAPSTTSGCAPATKNEGATNNVDYWTLDFDQSTEEYAQIMFAMPSVWDAGTITFEVFWTADSGSGDVIWALQGRAFANDDAIDQAWGTAQTVTDTLLATGDVHVSPTSSAITLAGTPAGGELCVFRVYRDADDGSDTLSGDAKLIGIRLYYNVSV